MLLAEVAGRVREELSVSAKIYPAVSEQLCTMARKKRMSVERLINLYLQMAVVHE
jgi:hypothetical protein